MRYPLKLTAAALIATTALFASGCNDQKKAANSERATVDDTFAKLQAAQPAHAMAYSPTRATKNFWIDTWGKSPKKLSYVYLQAAEGKMLGYYVLEGLPVSYCTSLVPTFDIDSDSNGKVTTPRPSMDGTYSTGTGGCNSYYGKDATTGAYIEYTAGLGINVLLFDQPLPPQKTGGAIALGPTSVTDVPK
jgi:heat shock protein HslJ